MKFAAGRIIDAVEPALTNGLSWPLYYDVVPSLGVEMFLRVATVFLLISLATHLCGADDTAKTSIPAPPARWIDPKGVPGPLVIVGGGELPNDAI